MRLVAWQSLLNEVSVLDHRVQLQTFFADFKAGRKQEADDVLREVLTSNPSKAGPLATPNGLVDTLPIGTKIFICTLRFSPLAERN